MFYHNILGSVGPLSNCTIRSHMPLLHFYLAMKLQPYFNELLLISSNYRIRRKKYENSHLH